MRYLILNKKFFFAEENVCYNLSMAKEDTRQSTKENLRLFLLDSLFQQDRFYLLLSHSWMNGQIW